MLHGAVIWTISTTTSPVKAELLVKFCLIYLFSVYIHYIYFSIYPERLYNAYKLGQLDMDSLKIREGGTTGSVIG